MKVPGRGSNTSPLDRALEYATLGYYVFPVTRGTKAGHLPGGWPASSIDSDQIRRWWAAHPTANIGIACKPSGIAVLDPDAPHEVTNSRTGEVGISADGKAAWLALAREHGWPDGADVTTPRGGSHIYYRDPHGLGNSAGDLPAGIDVRAGGGEHGGYVLAPGSVVEGRRYDGRLRAVADLPEVPVSLVNLLKAARRERQTSEPLGSTGQAVALIRECNAVRDAPEGGRNARLNLAAFNLGQLVGSELSEALVRASLMEVARDAGLDPNETDATIRSGLSKGMAHARPVATDASEREAKVQERLDWLRIQTEAQRRFVVESRPPAQPVEVPTLAQVLTLPPEPPMRVQGLIPSDSFTTIIAAAKTGKTTFVLNLVQSLLTGRAFLGVFPVQPVTGRVAMLNYEVNNRQLGRWADEAGVDHDRFLPVPLRGVSNPLGADHTRADLAARLRAANVETLIVDPFGRAFTGENENQTGEVGRFLTDLLQFAVEAVGARDLIMTAHTGHDTERVRGNSRLLGDPDSLITLVRNEDGERFMHAVGRDVDVSEDRLDYDEPNRRLVMSGQGSRQATERQRRTDERTERTGSLLLAVRQIVDREGRIKMGELTRALRDFQPKVTFRKGDEQQAVEEAQRRGWLVTEYPRPGHPRWVQSTAVTPPLPDPPRPSPSPSPGRPQNHPPRHPYGVGAGGGVGSDLRGDHLDRGGSTDH